jgi:hypothetical protein
MMLKPSEYLKKARALIEDSGHWTKNGLCFDDQGKPCDLDKATCFCAMGAVCRVFHDAGIDKYYHKKPYAGILDALYYALPPGYSQSGIMGFNDAKTTQHQDVLDVIDHAILWLEMDEEEAETKGSKPS